MSTREFKVPGRGTVFSTRRAIDRRPRKDGKGGSDYVCVERSTLMFEGWA
jgi:hypothetical protein